MPSKTVILLRGVNVGGRGIVPMAELRSSMRESGLSGVETLLQSGNLVVDTPDLDDRDLAQLVEEVVRERFGVTTTVISMADSEFVDAVRAVPFDPTAFDLSKLMLHFLSRSLDDELLVDPRVLELDPGRIRGLRRVIYQLCENGYTSAPQVAPLLERRFGVKVTVRNWNTTMRILGALTRSI